MGNINTELVSRGKWQLQDEIKYAFVKKKFHTCIFVNLALYSWNCLVLILHLRTLLVWVRYTLLAYSTLSYSYISKALLPCHFTTGYNNDLLSQMCVYSSLKIDFINFCMEHVKNIFLYYNFIMFSQFSFFLWKLKYTQ